MTALPRSISTSTPSGERRALDRRHHHAPTSVPIAPGGSAIPPAASIATSSPPICARELDHALGQRRAVGDDDEADHYAERPAARCRISIGWTVCTPVAFSMCQRQVSESHTARSGRASAICPNSRAPTSIAISYFSCLSP